LHVWKKLPFEGCASKLPCLEMSALGISTSGKEVHQSSPTESAADFSPLGRPRSKASTIPFNLLANLILKQQSS